MKYSKKKSGEVAAGDMTPMIDMTFQLIAFFMILINFSEADQDDRITLPSSELAKPPDAPLTTPLTLQLTEEGKVIFSGDMVPLDGLRPLLLREKQVLDRQEGGAAAATIIIRADLNAKTGEVQKLIETCQAAGFEKFALRAKQQST